jgi:HAD superfamily hydrolase (TIGR01509 family)
MKTVMVMPASGLNDDPHHARFPLRDVSFAVEVSGRNRPPCRGGGIVPSPAPADERTPRTTGMGVDLVIFDCDGVLVDSEIVSFEAEAEALSEIGIRVPLDDLVARFVGLSSTSAFAILEKEYDVRLPPDFAARCRQRVLDAFDSKLQPIPGVALLLEGLAHRRCVASSSEPTRIRHSLTLAGILHHFDPHIFSAVHVKNGKPAPDLFLYAAAQMGAAAERCIVIEDSVPGVTGARAAGMTVLGFTGGGHCRNGHADRLRVAGAAEVFGTMDELSRRLQACPIGRL